MDEGDCAYVQGCSDLARRTRAACLQCLRDDPQKIRNTRLRVHASRGISQSLINKEDGANPIHQRCQIGM